MTPSKFLPPHPSFESVRKQAKKLVRQLQPATPMLLAVHKPNCRMRTFPYPCETPS